jgi:hypothetical protein
MGLYTPGQVARMLGGDISSHRIRRLCESGLSQTAEFVNGRWQIPAAEAEGLQEYVKHEGDLPPIPRTGPPPPDDRRNPESERRTEPERYHA